MTVIVFLKAPKPGFVKTRLAKAVGAEKAAQIYHEMVDWINEKLLLPISNKGFQILYYWDSQFQKEEYRELFTVPNAKDLPQCNGDLGSRLKFGFEKFPGSKVCAIGTDCIELTPKILEQTKSLLDSSDVVIGPAADGGYYLIAMKKFFPFLFDGISWSTSGVAKQTVEKLKEHQISYALLETLNDIDTIEDYKKIASPLWGSQRRKT